MYLSELCLPFVANFDYRILIFELGYFMFKGVDQLKCYVSVAVYFAYFWRVLVALYKYVMS